MYRRRAAVTVTAVAAGAEETYEIVETNPGTRAQKGDGVQVNPLNAPEAGWGIIRAWVEAPGVIRFTASNFGAASLTGGSLEVVYTVLR
jgi:hypothetical protein